MATKRKEAPSAKSSPRSTKKSKINDQDEDEAETSPQDVANQERAEVKANGKGKGRDRDLEQRMEDPPSELDADTLRQFRKPEEDQESLGNQSGSDTTRESELSGDGQDEERENVVTETRSTTRDQFEATNPLNNLSKDTLYKYLPSQITSVRAVLAGNHPILSQVTSGESKGKQQVSGGEGEECLGLEPQWKTLHLILGQTILKGQSNSALMVGAGGNGKSLLLNSVLSSLLQSSSLGKKSSATSPPKSYYHVSLSGVLQSTDRLAMRELARQLIEQGAFGEGEIDIDDDPSNLQKGETEDHQKQSNPNSDDDEDDVREALDAELEEQLAEEEKRKEERREERERRRIARSNQEENAHLDQEDEDEEEDEEQEARERKIRELARTRQEEMERINMENAMMSSLANTMSSIMSLLSPQDSTTQSTSVPTPRDSKDKASLPLVISLDSFDLFTDRPRQALLYCLLDTVQAGSYVPGLSVIGMTRRVDTVDLLEKRVKSRFSHRMIHVIPPVTESEKNWNKIARQALMSPFPGSDQSTERRRFQEAWDLEVDELFQDDLFSAVLHDCWEISGDVREMYRILLRGFTAVSLSEPCILGISFAAAAEEDGVDLSMDLLNDLTTTEFALLIASKHLTLRSITDFTFEQCLDEVKRFEKKTRRDLDSNTSGVESNRPVKSKADGEEDETKLVGEDGLAHRGRAMMAFQSLLSLALFIPTSTLSSLALPLPSVHAHAQSTSHQPGVIVSKKQNASQLEYVKVRCTLEIGEIKEALRSKKANGKRGGGIGIRGEVLTWGLSMATT